MLSRSGESSRPNRYIRPRTREHGTREHANINMLGFNMLGSKIQQKVSKNAGKKPTQKEISAYYEQHKSQYGQPERRNILIIRTRTGTREHANRYFALAHASQPSYIRTSLLWQFLQAFFGGVRAEHRKRTSSRAPLKG
jgi:hypothetical protein